MGGERKGRSSKSMKASTRARATSSRKSKTKAKGERPPTATADVAPVVVAVAPDDMSSTQQEAELSPNDDVSLTSFSMPQSYRDDGADESEAIESQMVDLPHSLLEDVPTVGDSANGDEIVQVNQDIQDVHIEDGYRQVVDDGAGSTHDEQSVEDILEQVTFMLEVWGVLSIIAEQ
ncbi:hypothetical protein PINS_up021863 [Pythium insidiosum]|nr:hypothetical protein PINS_up021863 [Pythium insidiosum]